VAGSGARSGRGGGREGDGPERSVFVAAIGKHPGWNDHIEDLGLDTEALAELRQRLYIEGIGGNIDQGTWDELESSDRVEGFDHEFVWRRGGVLIGGRMWSSCDGKGRRKYPMIVCAQVPWGSQAWLLHEALGELDRLADQCRATEDAQRVREEVARSRASLRARWGERDVLANSEPGDDRDGSVRAAVELSGAEEMGPHRTGMYRLLYHIERDMGGAVRGRAVEVGGASRHVRVPRVMGSARAALDMWLGFSEERFAASTPVLIVAPETERWVDLLAGEPDTRSLGCLRAGTSAIPLVTEIPYTIEGDFSARADAWIEGQASGDPVERGARTGGWIGARLAGLGERSVIWMVAAGAVLLGLLAVAVLMLMFGGSGGGNLARDRDGERREAARSSTDRVQHPREDELATGGRAPSGSHAIEDATPARNGPAIPGAAERWKRWCLAYRDWYAALERGLDGGVVEADLDLRNSVLAKVGSHGTPATSDMDPRSVTASAVSDLGALAEDPPSDAIEPQAVARAREALLRMDAIRSALEPESWTARGDLKRWSGSFRARGWDRLADELEQAERGVVFDASLAQSIAAVVSSHRSVRGLAQAIARAERAGSALEATGEYPLTEAGRLVDTLHREGSDVDTTGALALGERAAGTTELLESAVRTHADRWERIDRDAFRAWFADRHGAPGRGQDSGELITAWIQAVTQDRWTLLDDREDPRRGPWRARVEGLDPLGQRIEALADSLEIGDEWSARHEAAVDRLDELDRRAEELDALRWTVDNRERIEREVESIDAGLTALEAMINDLGAQAERAAAREATRRAIDTLDALGNDLDAMSDNEHEPAIQAITRALETIDPAMLEDTTDAEGVRAIIHELSRLVDGTDAGGPGEMLSGAGPGAAGWTVELVEGGREVVYREPGEGPATLEFVRIDPTADNGLDRAVYLGRHEVSVAEFVAMVEAGGSWTELAGEWVELGKAMGGQPVSAGPRSWTWSQADGRLVPRAGWLDDAGERPEMYAAGEVPPGPQWSSPVQMLSARAATLVAGWAGCDLPSANVWRAGLGVAGGHEPENLRDRAWARQHAYVLSDSGVAPLWLDAGIFRPLIESDRREWGEDGRGPDAEPAVDRDDGWVWFAPVDVSRSGRVVHLVGNVAEFVELGPAGQGGSTVGVMGGSALSPGDVEPGRASGVVVFNMRRGYWDVGFRLSFWSPGPPPVRVRALDVLARAGAAARDGGDD